MDQHGFSIVEVMVAVSLLLIGMLGTLALVDTANVQTSNNRAREGATNLAREIVEAARAADYDDLRPATVAMALQAQPDLADATPDDAEWSLERRGVTYAVSVEACTYDDGKDGVNVAARDVTYCASSPATASPGVTRAEVNPDDFRRVDVRITWTPRSGTGRLEQTALIINPAGGLGPRLISFTADETGTPAVTFNSTSTGSKIDFTVQSTPAATVGWEASDGVSSGVASPIQPGGKRFAFAWNLKPVTDPDAVADGTYQVFAQAFDLVGIPGDREAVNVTIDRFAPPPPTGLTGGRNDRLADIVDLEWRLPERRDHDLIGYVVWRTPSAGGEPARVCEVDETTFACIDESPLDEAATYRVRAVDLDTAADDARREGDSSAPIGVPATAGARPQFGEGTLALAPDGELTWPAASDPDGEVRFYRIYRDGTSHADRLDRTETSQPRYVVRSADAAAHSYHVTAVDDGFNESEPLGPVSLEP